MDIKDYISSGIIERYALGSVSPQEKQEVECMSHIYPEIRTELLKQQEVIEKMASEMAVDPPKELKGRVMDAIAREKQIVPDADKKESGRVVAMKPKHKKEAKPKFNWAVAASILLLLGLGAYYVVSTSRVDTLKTELAETRNVLKEVESQKNQLSSDLSETDSAYQKATYANTVLARKSTRAIDMPGTPNQPEALVRVFWDTESSEVLMKVESLAEVPTGKQYQLWAIVDGQPTDMGVFDLTADVDELLIVPHQVADAQAFAITLEDEGGSPTPNLDALVAIGNV